MSVVPLFAILGESGGVGHGLIKDLTNADRTTSSKVKIFGPRNKKFQFLNIGGNNQFGSVQKAVPGGSHGPDHGIEIAYKQQAEAGTFMAGKTVNLVKCARGSSFVAEFANGFVDPLTGTSPQAVMFQKLDDAIAELVNQGATVELYADLWLVINDSFAGTLAATYKAAIIANIINPIRARYAAYAPASIGEVPFILTKGSPTYNTLDAKIDDMTTGGEVTHAYKIAVSDLTFRDASHLDSAGNINRGSRVITAWKTNFPSLI